MPRLTDEQIEAARQVDLFSFLSAQNPHELIRTGTSEYRTTTHGSLVITPLYWYWNKGGIGGTSAIDYLVKVCGVLFIEAVREVLSVSPQSEPPDITFSKRSMKKPKREMPSRSMFKLPSRAQDNGSAIRYLRARGISPNIIKHCIADGTIYQSSYQGGAVCVFVGHDECGLARFASLRGIDTNFKRDIAGSDKTYSFHLSAQKPNSLLLSVFESPIDALSHMTLGEIFGWEQGGYRLSLGGTSHIALTTFLERHQQINRVILHLDSDEAGILGAIRIKRHIKADDNFKHIRITVSPTGNGKDMNERLMRVIKSYELTEN